MSKEQKHFGPNRFDGLALEADRYFNPFGVAWHVTSGSLSIWVRGEEFFQVVSKRLPNGVDAVRPSGRPAAISAAEKDAVLKAIAEWTRV
jgi:hypothetical protein